MCFILSFYIFFKHYGLFSWFSHGFAVVPVGKLYMTYSNAVVTTSVYYCFPSLLVFRCAAALKPQPCRKTTTNQPTTNNKTNKQILCPQTCSCESVNLSCNTERINWTFIRTITVLLCFFTRRERKKKSECNTHWKTFYTTVVIFWKITQKRWQDMASCLCNSSFYGILLSLQGIFVHLPAQQTSDVLEIQAEFSLTSALSP